MTRRELLGALSAVAAMGQAARDDPGQAAFRVDVGVVNTMVSVRDKQGKVVRDLTKEDFTLTENGHPQEIRYFSAQSSTPLSLGLLIDTSGSQVRLLSSERRASYQFLRQVMREDLDKAFVIHFDFESELLQDVTSSKRDLEAALSDVQAPEPRAVRMGRGRGPGRGRPQGGTVLHDAVMLAADEVTRKIEGRKAIILLSDGDDHGSKVSLNTAIEAAQRADTLVYAILFSDISALRPVNGGVRIALGAGNGKKVMKRIAEETGGGYFEVSNKLPIEKIYTEIEDELRNQYSLGYVSNVSGESYRKIKVTVNRAGLVVQTRDGYYARN